MPLEGLCKEKFLLVRNYHKSQHLILIGLANSSLSHHSPPCLPHVPLSCFDISARTQ